MDYETYLLSNLLNKYERSSLFHEGTQKRRILYKPSNDQHLQRIFQDGQEKQKFLKIITELESIGLIEYKWLKFEEDNILQEIWLNTQEEMIALAYQKTNRVPKNIFQDQLVKRLKREVVTVKKYENKLLLKSILAEAEDKNRRWNPSFTPEILVDILSVLHFLEGQENQMIDKRILSINVFKDSKYFEEKIQRKLLSLFSKYVFDWKSNEITVTDKLLDLGIGKSPELLYFSGAAKCYFSDDHILDVSWYKEGFTLNSNYLSKLNTISGKFTKLITIENLANYYWFLKSQAINHFEEYFVFYTAGFLSSNQIQFIEAIDKTKLTKVYHWGDIDLGGMRIFKQVKELLPTCLPYKMDSKTYTEFQNFRKSISDEYLSKIKILLHDNSFSHFQEVLKLIITNREILEQEAELY